jgi:type IV pilus assembly protein PilZ
MVDPSRRQSPRIKARLKVRFKNANAFISEYTQNISKGGLFVRTRKPCASGSIVEVVLVIPDTEQEVSAMGDVIHVVDAEAATEARPAGMGLELKEISPEAKALIEGYISDRLKEELPADGLGRREHRRYDTRIRVRFGSLEALFEEYSHNLSHGGIFIRTSNPKPLQEKLKIILTHPVTQEEILLEGEVVRLVTVDDAQKTGQPPGMGVRFDDLDQFAIEQLQAFINLVESP